MKVTYIRVSSILQNTDRQLAKTGKDDVIIEDSVSGTVPFFERPGGKKILELIHSNSISELKVHQIDRLGRNLLDILNTIKYFTEHQIPIQFITQGLKTLDDKGHENPISKMIISILGIVSEMERNNIRERQLEGIAIAKAKGKFLGRKTGTTEDVHKFLNKPTNKKVLEYLRKNYTQREIAKILGVSINTVGKVKKLGLSKAVV